MEVIKGLPARCLAPRRRAPGGKRDGLVHGLKMQLEAGGPKRTDISQCRHGLGTLEMILGTYWHIKH